MQTPCRQGVVPQSINHVSGKTELKRLVAAKDWTFGPQIAFATAPSPEGLGNNSAYENAGPTARPLAGSVMFPACKQSDLRPEIQKQCAALPLHSKQRSSIAKISRAQVAHISGGSDKMPVVKTEALSLEKLRRLAAGDEPAETHVLELLESMRSEDEEVRAWASDALHAVENLPKGLAQSVADMCLQPSAAVSAAACRMLLKLGDEATQYQTALVTCLTQHNEITARQQAALALSSVDGLTIETLDALRAAANSTDPRLKRLATNALNQRVTR